MTPAKIFTCLTLLSFSFFATVCYVELKGVRRTVVTIDYSDTDKAAAEFVYDFRNEIAKSSVYSLERDLKIPDMPIAAITVKSTDDHSTLLIVEAQKIEGKNMTTPLHMLLHTESSKTRELSRKVLAALDKEFRQ